MKHLVASSLAVLAAGVSLTACGSSTPSAAQQIRSTEAKTIQAALGKDPQDACQYATDSTREACFKAMTEAQMFSGSLKGLLPTDWKQRLAHQAIHVHGNTATADSMTHPGVAAKASHFVKQDGEWLTVYSGS